MFAHFNRGRTRRMKSLDFSKEFAIVKTKIIIYFVKLNPTRKLEIYTFITTRINVATLARFNQLIWIETSCTVQHYCSKPSFIQRKDITSINRNTSLLLYGIVLFWLWESQVQRILYAINHWWHRGGCISGWTPIMVPMSYTIRFL